MKEKMMKNSDTHIYLYAKGHYIETDTLEDMKKIVAERCGFNAEDVRVKDIQSILTSIAFKIIINSGNPEHFFDDFIEGISPDNMWRIMTKQKMEDYDFNLAVIEKCLSVIRFVSVKDDDGNRILELDEPNGNILPLKMDWDKNETKICI
jgi:hypothetical protein